MKITVAGVGYVGLSLAVLLAQNHEVTAITTTESKAEKLNKFYSPIQDDEIERLLDNFSNIRDAVWALEQKAKKNAKKLGEDRDNMTIALIKIK